ncbi:DUF2917 domain-containing protein [Chitinivorax sp. B]|uniref:DUF2917 domain-containing protein n=1 Tax=Chitinivorax sp. B TaxID=2502235 RepID=UPI0010F79F09|nr:DUF2917 domain-containing protein [Chitinivorax sp. B]
MKTYQLAMQTVLRLDRGRTALITCTRGMVWLTEAGQDIVLRCGESHRIRGMDRTVIEPLAYSTVSIEHPALVKVATLLDHVQQRFIASLARLRRVKTLAS